MTTNDENNKIISDLEQALETILRTIPGSLFSYYKKLCEEGFSDDHAFQLTRDYHEGLWLKDVTKRVNNEHK